MRQFSSFILAGLAATFLAAGQAGAGNVEVKGPHICCGQCVKVAKVTYSGPGPQRDVRIEGAGLESSAVIQSLRKAGFNGTVEK